MELEADVDEVVDVAVLSWALVEAPAQMMLVLEASPGRHPVRVERVHPEIVWRRHDGRIECLNSVGNRSRELLLVQREMVAGDVLVGDYRAAEMSAMPEKVWLLGAAGHDKACRFGPVGVGRE